MFFQFLPVVLFESYVPCDGSNCSHSPELVNDVAWQEVNVIIIQVNPDVSNPIST